MGPPCYVSTGLPQLLQASQVKNRYRIPPKADPEFVQQALANFHHRQSPNKCNIINHSTGIPEVPKIVHFHGSCNNLQTIYQMTVKACHAYSS